MNPLSACTRRRLRGCGTSSTRRSPTRRPRTSRPMPGLAESWEESDGRADVDVQAARRSQVVRRRAADLGGRRVHDQHVARGGVAQPHRRDREPDRDGARRDTVDRSSPRCRTRSCRRWTSTSCPSTSGSKSRQTERRPYDGRGRRRLRPVRARRAARRASSWTAAGQPELLAAASRRSTSRAPHVQQPRRDGRRAQAGRDRRGAGRPRRAFVPTRRTPTTSRPSRATRAASSELAINGGAGLGEAASRAAGRPACARRSPTRSTSETIVDRVLAGLGTAAETLSAVAEPGVDRRDAARAAVHASTSTAATRSSTRPATRTPTATASARCPAAASR